MTLGTDARERLTDVRELEPTTNGELRERWGLDSGKDVARYLRNELGEYVYRDDDKRIRARNGTSPDAPAEQPATGGVNPPEPSDDPGGSGKGGGPGKNSHTGEDSDESSRTHGPDDGAGSGPEPGQAANGGATRDLSTEDDESPSPSTEDTTVPRSAPPVEAGGGNGGVTVQDSEQMPTSQPTPDGPSEGPTRDSKQVSVATPDVCPRCGHAIEDGETFEREITAMASNGEKLAQRFIDVNEGVDPVYACENWLRCGYYKATDGERQTFESPQIDGHPATVLAGCPDCGGELIDVRTATSLDVGGGQQVAVPEDVQYVCGGCGQGWNE